MFGTLLVLHLPPLTICVCVLNSRGSVTPRFLVVVALLREERRDEREERRDEREKREEMRERGFRTR